MDLFAVKPEYTIDICAFTEMFNETRPYCKKHFPGLWNNICKLINEGRMISHIEVYKEIMEGNDELAEWAEENKFAFKEYDLVNETPVIALIGTKFEKIVNGKVKSIHADPWLIAQAKAQNLSIITQEKFSNSPSADKAKIPNVCRDSDIGVKSLDLYGLIQAEGWSFN